jgi:hypothetical protein
MNLSEKEKIAESTIKKEDDKIEEENKVIAEIHETLVGSNNKTIIKEDIKADE